MNARDFLDTYGRHEAKRVAIVAGSNYAYLWQLARGYRVASRDMAEKLEAASDGRMDRVSLVWPEWRPPGNGDDRGISAAAAHDGSGE